MKTAVLVTLKDIRRAKSRLAGVLAPGERSDLVWTMFEDVCSALEHAACTVVLVTDYQRAAARADQLRWKVLLEQQQISESHSVDTASVQLAAEGFQAVMRLPADIPLVQSRDIDEILSALPDSPAAVAVPSLDETGTNAILRSPPDLFPSHFGPRSLDLHREEARRVSANFTVLRNGRVALDLDDARDLERFFRLGSDTRTQRCLVRIGWKERMERHAEERLHSRN